MLHRYRGFAKYSANEVDPWDGGMTPTVILGLVEAEGFRALTRTDKLKVLREALRQHDADRDLYEQTVRMVESATVPIWIRLRRRWEEYIYETDRYTSYGRRRE